MSNKSTIKCPNCQHEFEVTDAFRDEVQRDLNTKAKEWQQKREEEFKKKEEDFSKNLNEALSHQKKTLEENLKRTISNDYENQIRILKETETQNNEKLKEARQKELEFLRKEQELKNKEAELEINIQKKLQEERTIIAEQIKKQEQEKNTIKEGAFLLRQKELEMQLEDQKKLVDEMKRKAEQRSMQSQGEAQELVLEELLKATFPFDEIEEVGKGVKGADCIQLVKNNFGTVCGKIIYESKRTKAFGGDWIDKLKADMRFKNADVAVLVTETMPKDLEFFGLKDGVWICTYTEVKALSHVLRDGIIKVAIATKTQENKGEKMTMLYNYLTSNEFAEQWKAIREGFLGMRLSIQKEKDAMERLWKAREKQLEKVLLNAAHIRGSIDGIAGLESIDLNLLDEGNNLELE